MRPRLDELSFIELAVKALRHVIQIPLCAPSGPPVPPIWYARCDVLTVGGAGGQRGRCRRRPPCSSLIRDKLHAESPTRVDTGADSRGDAKKRIVADWMTGQARERNH